MAPDAIPEGDGISLLAIAFPCLIPPLTPPKSVLPPFQPQPNARPPPSRLHHFNAAFSARICPFGAGFLSSNPKLSFTIPSWATTWPKSMFSVGKGPIKVVFTPGLGLEGAFEGVFHRKMGLVSPKSSPEMNKKAQMGENLPAFGYFHGRI